MRDGPGKEKHLSEIEVLAFEFEKGSIVKSEIWGRDPHPFSSSPFARQPPLSSFLKFSKNQIPFTFQTAAVPRPSLGQPQRPPFTAQTTFEGRETIGNELGGVKKLEIELCGARFDAEQAQDP